MTLAPSARRCMAPIIIALTLSLAVGGTGQAQTADDIHAGILTSLGLGDAASGDLSSDHQAGLTDFMGRARVFADDLDRALRAETVPEGRSPREAAENLSLADLHALLSDMDPEQMINLITGYTPQDDTPAALMRAFAPVLPPHLGARRAELEAEFSAGFDDFLEFSLSSTHRDLTASELKNRKAVYSDIIAEVGIHSALRTLFEERSIPPVEAIGEPQFYALFDAFSQARARGEYSGDDAEYFVDDVLDLYQKLYQGDDVQEMFRSLVTPMLNEDTAKLHPRLLVVYESDIEIARRDEEIARRDEEIARRDEEIARQREIGARLDEEIARRDEEIAEIRARIEARAETLRILGLVPAEE